MSRSLRRAPARALLPLERRRPHGIMRADAARRIAGVGAGLSRSVEDCLGVQPPASGPGGVGVAVADARCGHVPDTRVRKRRHHPPQIVGRGNVIGVELGDDVVVAIAPVVVEEREVALLALGPPWPRCVVGTRPRPPGSTCARRGPRTNRSPLRSASRRPATRRMRKGSPAGASPQASCGRAAMARTVPW